MSAKTGETPSTWAQLSSSNPRSGIGKPCNYRVFFVEMAGAGKIRALKLHFGDRIPD